MYFQASAYNIFFIKTTFLFKASLAFRSREALFCKLNRSNAPPSMLVMERRYECNMRGERQPLGVSFGYSMRKGLRPGQSTWQRATLAA